MTLGTQGSVTCSVCQMTSFAGLDDVMERRPNNTVNEATEKDIAQSEQCFRNDLQCDSVLVVFFRVNPFIHLMPISESSFRTSIHEVNDMMYLLGLHDSNGHAPALVFKLSSCLFQYVISNVILSKGRHFTTIGF